MILTHWATAAPALSNPNAAPIPNATIASAKDLIYRYWRFLETRRRRQIAPRIVGLTGDLLANEAELRQLD
jgi:hypothetical protein